MKKKKVKLLGNRVIKKKRVVIECSEKQALLIEIALDVMSRMCAGQIDQLILGLERITNRRFEHKGKVGLSLGMYIEELIKPILFPELEFNESYGVGCWQIGEAQILYEMVKILQNYRSRNMENPGVLAGEPLHSSKEDLIKVAEISPSNSQVSFGKAGDTYI